MPYTVTHVLSAIILIELFRQYCVRKGARFPRYYILIAAVAGILPDLDYVIFYALYPFGFTIAQIHRTFLHTIFVPLILFLIGVFIWRFDLKSAEISRRHMALPAIFFILSAGSLLHLVLDALIVGKVVPFYPFNLTAVGLDLIKYLPKAFRDSALISLDTLMLFIWLFWMEFKLKIRDYF